MKAQGSTSTSQNSNLRLLSSLSDAHARERLREYGPNELPRKERGTLITRLLKLLSEPMLLLLVFISIIYLVMGELTEGIALGASAVVVIAIAYYQDFKSERALDALRDLSSPRAFVIRENLERRIPARDVVPGDLIVLHEGDRVPADGELLLAEGLTVDESLLTGEAFPVNKEVDQQVYMGTLVVGGKGFCRVGTTGARTEMGKIGTSLAETGAADTFLSREIRRLVRIFGITGAILCLGITVIFGLMRSDWLGGILAGLATAMSLLPEEFPVVLTVFLALGAWRLARVKVLVRNPSATERLGAITSLCVDKTGTITMNQMTVAKLALESKKAMGLEELESETGLDALLEWSVLASSPHPFDPMDKAIHHVYPAPSDMQLLKEYPLTKELFATSFAWRHGSGDKILAATKGAPEAVLGLCKITGERAESIRLQAEELARQGLRVLGVGKAEAGTLPTEQTGFSFTWVGLVGFEDPVRPEVPEAMRLCAEAGVRVYMMTGDFPETARIVAAKAGLKSENKVLTGADIEGMNDESLAKNLEVARIFARMRPEQKLRVVKSLKASGHVVGMTGDGVNDAPSLHQSDVGIAMGARGTDVAREASDIVLVDDNFASIIAGIEYGRTIFSNIKKSMSYIISIHVPIAGLAFFPVLFGWPMILFPIHIALLELILDPTCSLLFEAQESDSGIMKKPPRPVDAPLFSSRDYWRCSMEGLLILIPSLLLYWSELKTHQDENLARTVSFLFLGCCNVGLIVADLSGGRISQFKRILKSRTNVAVIAALGAMLLALIKSPPLVKLFHFTVLSNEDVLKVLGLSLAFFLLTCFWNRAGKR